MMELFSNRGSKSLKSSSCGSLSSSAGSSTPSPISTDSKPKSPKFMSRLMDHNIRKKKKLPKFITSVYSERTPQKPAPPTHGPVFGVPLVTAVQRSRVSDKLPLCRVFQEAVLFIETFALTREGIYRVPGFRAKLTQLKELYDRGEPVDLTNYDPETVGQLLKLYLRELPEPLLTRQLGAQFEGVIQYEDIEQRTVILCAMLRELPPENYATLALLCLHINHVSHHQQQNKMTLSNLVIILSPTLLISNTLLFVLCENAHKLFPGVLLDPDQKIPLRVEMGELNPKQPTPQQQNDLVQEELVQRYVWVQARNDALRYMEDHLRAQLSGERKTITSYQNQLRDLEDQNYTIGDTAILQNCRRSKKGSDNSDNHHVESSNIRTEEDVRAHLSTLEHMNNEYEADKTNLYNSIIKETFACIDVYTEVRFRQTFVDQKTRS